MENANKNKPVKIIYCCYGGSHSSVTAAAVHLGIIRAGRLPGYREFMQVPFYDKQVKTDHGQFFLLGHDEFNNPVYIVGKHNLGKTFEKMIRQVADAFQINQNELILIDTMPYVNLTMMVGGFTSRRLGITWLGRPIVIRGTRKALPKIIALVSRIKTMLIENRKNYKSVKDI